MIKRLLTIHRPALIGLWTMFCLLSLSSAYAQTYELNVGERKTLPYPTPPAGYVDHIGTGRCTNKSDCIGVNGLQIYVYNYFTGTATVEIEYNYTYTGSDKRTHVGNATAYYSVKCKPTEVKLSKSTLELESGDEVELSYSTVPSGLEPEVEWKTTNKSVATLSSENQYNRETISNEKKIYVSAETAGTCVVKLGCNTGYPAPECTITVVDNHWVKADVTGSVKKGTKVTLSSTKAGATIYYTTDGTEPSKSSTRYSSPIEINKDMTIKAKAYLGNQESKTSTFNYTVVSHLKGEIFKAKTIEGVELSFVVKSSYSGVCLEVSSGNTYTPAIDKNYSGKITIPYKVDDITVYYIGERAFYDCNITNVVFEENLYVSPKTIRKEAFRNCKKLKTVSFPHGISLETMAFYNCSALENIVFEGYTNYNYGATTDMFNSCNSLKEVYIKWGSVMNEIRDNCFSEQAYNNAILYVPETLMSKYQSTSGWKKFKNIVAIGSEPNKKLTITASPSGGEVSKGTVVYLTASSDGSTVSGCDIYYTLNGSTPTKSSTKYTSSGISINSNCTLKAIAYKDGYDESNVLTEKYTIKSTSKPKLTLSANPSGGSIENGTKVYLTAKADGSTVSGCDIYYTTNGNTPTKSSTKYTSSGITINSACTLKAIAYKSGYEDSEVLTATYTIKETPKPKLVLSASPSGGQVSSGTKVTLTAKADGSTVSGCDIYYTTNGNTPSKSSTSYTSSGITINSACTLKAIAYKDGYETSDVLTESYTMQNTQKVNPTSIRINCSSVSMKTTDTFELYYSYEYPKDTPYSSQAKPSVTWTSNNNSVVTVSELYPSTVELTAKSIGIAIITVKSTTGLSAICEVKVISQPELAKLDVKQISCGGDHSMVLLTDGTLWACGENNHGQLGDGTTTDCNSLKQVMNDVAYVSAGYMYTMFLKTDGTLWACGRNHVGQLGDGTTIDKFTPKQVMTDVASVSVSNSSRTPSFPSHTMILKTDGTLWACGSNFWGQLGDGSTRDCLTPKQVMDEVASVSVGGYHTLIVKKDGSLWTCGGNDDGQLGNGTISGLYESSSIPKQIMTGVAAVSAGYCHSMILKTDGTLWACGLNGSGQLGDSTTIHKDVSSLKQIMHGVAAVSAGQSHTLVLKNDGKMCSFSDNYYGQAPREMTKVAFISAGRYHSLFLKTNGSLWAAGYNFYGQLGDYTNIDRHTPVMITDILKVEKTSIATSVAGCATFFDSESAYTLPNGLVANVVTRVENNKLTYKTIADGSVAGVVPKGVPVMIESDAKQAGTYTLTAVESDVSYTDTNLLRGSDEATTTTGDGYHYKLSYGPTGTKWDDVFGWYWGAQNGAPFQIEGHKAWLVVPKNGTRATGFTIEGESLDIEAIDHSPSTTNCYYDLQGRRITDMQNVTPKKKGVYIRNGQKVVVK